MSVKSSRMYTAPAPKMPPGLVELMEGLAKDVLKCNPPDVYSFCANHMQKLMEIRDGPTTKCTMTLDQKIAMAIKKIRERAARRREDYDKKMQTYKQSESQNNEGYENNGIDKNNSDARQYAKDKIVKIPEEDLAGEEHEIIVNIKEKFLTSEAVKLTEKDSEMILAETKSSDDDLSATLQQSIITNDVKDDSLINVTENIDNNKTIEEVGDNLTNEKEEKVIEINQIGRQVDDKLDTIPFYEEKSVESVETHNNGENKSSTVALVKTEDYFKSETSPHNHDNLENCKNTANMQNKEDDFISISIIVDEPKDLSVFEEREDKAIIDLNIEKTPDIDEITICSSLITEEVNTNKDQISLHFLEEQQDNTVASTPSALPEGDELLNSNNSELENHVNNTSMDLETAAITIQKVFRNFLFKNKTLSTDDATNVDINSLIEDKTEKGDNDMSSMNVNKDRRTLGLSRMDTVLQTVNEEKSLSQSTDDSSTLSSAATIIQAHVRGYLIRNKLNLNKNSSTTSGVDSDGLSFTSMEGDNDNRKNKTILNIHIVPESGHFMSRDESVLTSIDLSMDGSPPCSTNLHPLAYDTSERRKQLKREDAFQSTSPPSNNSGKLSEDVDSIKELLISENNKDENPSLVESGNKRTDVKEFVLETTLDDDSTMVDNLDTALEVKSLGPFDSPEKHLTERPYSLPELASDEMDVITPFTPSEDRFSKNSNLIHSGEFHEIVLPTQVSRGDTSVVREFQNVLVYFLLWNNA
ncbi:origin recognition complex subunit 1-like [Maniola jurtina]|uniref:origin recognition complex subunit 1-like n=1 Tax=Maniola jurtina TaxID=191418 RepID=UPI001E685E6F|nr:origin recognition complex subunit 1-like [Maniola jurtina]